MWPPSKSTEEFQLWVIDQATLDLQHSSNLQGWSAANHTALLLLKRLSQLVYPFFGEVSFIR